VTCCRWGGDGHAGHLRCDLFGPPRCPEPSGVMDIEGTTSGTTSFARSIASTSVTSATTTCPIIVEGSSTSSAALSSSSAIRISANQRQNHYCFRECVLCVERSA
jgi:hypothetical protein